MQLNHIFEPLTEHRASACSTKDRGMRATSSKNTPERVIPCISAAEPSSLPPKRYTLLVLPRKVISK